MSTSAVLDRLQAVESRSDAVLRPMVERALADVGPTGREARRRSVAALAAAVGAGPEPRTGGGAPAPGASGGPVSGVSGGPVPGASGGPVSGVSGGSVSAASGEPLPGAFPEDAADEVVAAALVEVMPRTVAWLIAEGMSEPDVWRSMADVPRKIATYGVRGTGAEWLATVATGSVVTIGRLQFERPAAAPGRPPGEPAWGVHIPELGPLDPGACDAAFAAAPAILERLWGVGARWWTCDSWVLDPRLADLLGSRANLVRFANRFTVLPDAAASDGDASIAKFVFGTSVSDMRTAEPVGRLQTGLRAILDTGDHWTEQVGIAPVRS